MDKEEAKRTGKQSKESPRGMRQHVSGSPLPSRLVTEKVMRDVHRVMQGQEFQSIEEANAFLARLAGPGLKEALEKAATLSPQQEAQELAYRAMEAPTRKRALPLAQQALAKDPDCVDALVALAAANARSVEDLIARLEKAVEAGERSLGARYFEENKGHFWGILETRPYLRARQQLAELLLDAGRVSEAIGHFEALLDLHPNDNQGVRDILLGCYLAGNELDGARRLSVYTAKTPALSSPGDERWSAFCRGTSRAPEHDLKYARNHNRFVELYLTGKKKLLRAMPDSYSFDSEEEALICVETMGEAWAVRRVSLVAESNAAA